MGRRRVGVTVVLDVMVAAVCAAAVYDDHTGAFFLMSGSPGRPTQTEGPLVVSPDAFNYTPGGSVTVALATPVTVPTGPVFQMLAGALASSLFQI